MMYDMSGGGDHLRTFTSVGLAWWHSYKHAVGSIWKVFASTIWAPQWHRLYPGAKFYAKTRSPQEPSMHFLYLMKVYHLFKPLLDATLLEPGISADGKALLTNIRFLCEFALPVVTHITHHSLSHSMF